MREIIINIPHASLCFPGKLRVKKVEGQDWLEEADWATEIVALDKAQLDFYAKKMADEDLDKLFLNRITKEDDLLESCRYALFSGNYGKTLTKFATGIYTASPYYSRLHIDMERFMDDSKEPMAKLGQGVVYTHVYDGTRLIKEEYEEKYLKVAHNQWHGSYQSYHLTLKRYIEARAQYNEMIIVDLHSFDDEVAKHYPTYDKNKSMPDVCLGYDAENCSQVLLDECRNYFEGLGYTVAINYPYSGSYYPLDIKPKNIVASIMIELNKRIYLGDEKKFRRVSREIQKLMLQLRGAATAEQDIVKAIYNIDTSIAPKFNWSIRGPISAYHPSFPDGKAIEISHVGDCSFLCLYGDEASQMMWSTKTAKHSYSLSDIESADEKAAIFGWLMEEAIKQGHEIQGGCSAYYANVIRPYQNEIAKLKAKGQLSLEQKQELINIHKKIAEIYKQCEWEDKIAEEYFCCLEIYDGIRKETPSLEAEENYLKTLHMLARNYKDKAWNVRFPYQQKAWEDAAKQYSAAWNLMKGSVLLSEKPFRPLDFLRVTLGLTESFIRSQNDDEALKVFYESKEILKELIIMDKSFYPLLTKLVADFIYKYFVYSKSDEIVDLSTDVEEVIFESIAAGIVEPLKKPETRFALDNIVSKYFRRNLVVIADFERNIEMSIGFGRRETYEEHKIRAKKTEPYKLMILNAIRKAKERVAPLDWNSARER